MELQRKVQSTMRDIETYSDMNRMSEGYTEVQEREGGRGRVANKGMVFYGVKCCCPTENNCCDKIPEVVCTVRLTIGFLLVLSKWCAQSRLATGF
jgi:hypothetical protein